MVNTIKQATDLIRLFDTLYQKKVGRKYNGNLHADKWGFRDIIDDLGYDKAKFIVKYYFKTTPSKGHSRTHLIYHYHEYVDEIRRSQKEKAVRRQIASRMREQYEGRD